MRFDIDGEILNMFATPFLGPLGDHAGSTEKMESTSSSARRIHQTRANTDDGEHRCAWQKELVEASWTVELLSSFGTNVD